MGLRSGRITKREVRNPTRKYIRRMAIPINNDGEQPSNSTREGTITATSTEPIPSIVNTTAISSTMVTPSIMQEGIVSPPSVTQSHPVTLRHIMAIEFRPFTTGFAMPMSGRQQPYGMPTSVMASLYTNPSNFAKMLQRHIRQYWRQGRP